MSGLNQVRDAVIAALKEAGLTAIPAYEGKAKRYTSAVAAVDVASAEGKPAGFCSYLGERYEETKGTVQELYGMQMNVTLSLEIRAEGAAACEEAMEKAAEALMENLAPGLKLGELRWNGIAWDKSAGMFLRKGSAACRAAFVAESCEGGGTLRDFILKGTMKS